MTTAILTAALVLGAEPVADYRPARAVAAALSIAEQHPTPELLRFVWITPWLDAEGKSNAAGVTSFVANTAMSHNSLIHRPAVHGDLVVFDLEQLAGGDVKKLALLIAVYDRLATFEPCFHASRVVDGATAVISRPGIEADHERLVALTGTTAPIVRHDFFCARAMSSIDDGLYFQFRGFTVGKTTETEWLTAVGGFRQTAGQLGADRRAGIGISGVTDKQRIIEWYPSLQHVGGAVWFTYDFDAESARNAGRNSMRNFLDFDHDATEAIGNLSNGMQAFAMFNGKGILQASVPDTIARNNSPHPKDGRLHTASCITCHGPRTMGEVNGVQLHADGYQPFTNEVHALLKSGLNLFGDLSQVDQLKARNRLAQLYQGDPTIPLGYSRIILNAAVRRATGGGMDAASVSRAFADLYADYLWAPVTPERAALELGFPESTIADCVPLLPADDTGVVPEDPIIARLRAGLSITRQQFEVVMPDMLERTMP